MSINLADYAELLEDLSPHSQEALQAAWHEATKVFSPRGLDNYLKGTAAIHGLGKGDSLVETWIEEAPMVAKEVGEDVIGDLAAASLMLASRTSGAVIELLLATVGHRRQPPRRRPAVPQLPAIHQHPDRAGAARRAADAGQAGSAVPAADAGRPAPLGAVGRACPPHQLRGADPLFQPRVERVAGDAAEGAQGHPAGGRAAAHQHVSARTVGARFLHAPHLGRLRIARGLQALHRGLPHPPPRRLRRLQDAGRRKHRRARGLPRHRRPRRGAHRLHARADLGRGAQSPGRWR